MADSQKTRAFRSKRRAMTSMAAAAAPEASNHHGDGTMPTRVAAPAAAPVKANVPPEIHNASAATIAPPAVGTERRLAAIRRACYHADRLQLIPRTAAATFAHIFATESHGIATECFATSDRSGPTTLIETCCGFDPEGRLCWRSFQPSAFRPQTR